MLTYNPPPQEPQERDVMFDDAVKIVIETGIASSSLLQRRLRLGYARSARLLDQLQEAGIVGPGQGANPRAIFVPHKSYKGQEIVTDPKPNPAPTPAFPEEPAVHWNKTKYANDKPGNLEINIGADDDKNPVNFDLEHFGNLLVIGSQFTGAVDFLNNILVTSVAKYSPDELQIIAIDAIAGDLTIPRNASHLITPVLIEPEKAVSALKWAVAELERRYKFLKETGVNNLKDYLATADFQRIPNIFILINGLNEIMLFSPTEVEENIYRIMIRGRKYGLYLIIGADYPNPKTAKEIIANSPAKLVFKPANKKIARETGIPESVDLVSPNEAILETMFEGKKKITIDKIDTKKIYEEIFE